MSGHATHHGIPIPRLDPKIWQDPRASLPIPLEPPRPAPKPPDRGGLHVTLARLHVALVKIALGEIIGTGGIPVPRGDPSPKDEIHHLGGGGGQG